MPHLLYSYRRCPYAMRARMALKQANIPCQIIEISLKEKPAEMLAYSPKGTVPVLVTEDKTILDESLDIMTWALSQHDPDHWLDYQTDLIAQNDGWFKQALDRYKYPARYPDEDCSKSRENVYNFFKILDAHFQDKLFLNANHPTIDDIAIFPFIRQAAHTDKHWFLTTPFNKLQAWLDNCLNLPVFIDVMHKNLKNI